ncbi:hypothetical protein L2E82_01180 [Cichorium intybus]|uniref:Uncharacterized protein n=1 Tax=Cichorium intybus TaxID=13427 RepID=A0ACB9GY58_CICIN|nr:hypothetical protein L2E82_01180 [Cichorium intybus]
MKLYSILDAWIEYSIFKDQCKLKGKEYFKLLQKKLWTLNRLTLLTGKKYKVAEKTALLCPRTQSCSHVLGRQSFMN